MKRKIEKKREVLTFTLAEKATGSGIGTMLRQIESCKR